VDVVKMKAQLIKHEGLKTKPYRCTKGKLTIGVGRNLDDVGISNEEIGILLTNDVRACIGDLGFIFTHAFFNSLPDKIQMVLIDMRFNLGPKRFRGFKNMIQAVQNKKWEDMIYSMKNSLWYGQVGERGANLVKMVDEVIKG